MVKWFEKKEEQFKSQSNPRIWKKQFVSIRRCNSDQINIKEKEKYW